MKNLLVYFIIPIIVISSGNIDQKEINISGKIKGYQDSTMVILNNLDNNTTVDTTFIYSNQFDFTISKSEPTPHGLIIGNEFIFFWVENEDITIEGKKDDLRYAVKNGGKVQKQDNDFQKLTKPLDLQFQSVNSELLKAFEEENKEKIEPLKKQVDKIILDRFTLGAKYIRENPNNLISAFALQNFIAGLPKSEVKSLYMNLSPEIKETKYANSVSKFLELSKDVKIGDIADGFQLPDITGNIVSLNEFQGKFVLLEFWASGCGPCRAENKKLLTIYKKYKNKGFEIISISSDKNDSHWKSATKEDGITWASLSADGQIAAKYNVKLIPSNFLINPSGKIIAMNLHGEELAEKLEELLND